MTIAILACLILPTLTILGTYLYMWVCQYMTTNFIYSFYRMPSLDEIAQFSRDSTYATGCLMILIAAIVVIVTYLIIVAIKGFGWNSLFAIYFAAIFGVGFYTYSIYERIIYELARPVPVDMAAIFIINLVASIIGLLIFPIKLIQMFIYKQRTITVNSDNNLVKKSIGESTIENNEQTEIASENKINEEYNTEAIKKVNRSAVLISKFKEKLNKRKDLNISKKEDKKSKKDEITYHIVFREELNKWEVRTNDSVKALKLFNTQLEAIKYADEYAYKEHRKVYITTLNGKIRKHQVRKPKEK